MKPWNLALSVLLVVAAGCGCGNQDKPSTADATSGSTGTSGNPSASVSVTGAGSTFVEPAMTKWIYAYKDVDKNVSINYQPVGSGAGISNLKDGTVDFAASDVPMSDADLTKMPTPTVQIPVTSGCVAIAYNLPGVKSGLKLSGDVLADIYLGKITTWNDPRIVQLNAGTTIPATPIQVVHRSDGSGTTYIFTDYLSSVSPAWNAGPKKGKTIKWPTGVGGTHTDGVAGVVKQTQGAIGYVELAYVIQNKMTYASLQNKSGKFVDPTIESTAAAANAAIDALKKDLRTSIVDTAAPDGYPIAGFTYALMSKTPKDAAKGKAVLDFLKWTLGAGQDMAKDLQYAPLPKAITDLNETALSEVQAK